MRVAPNSVTKMNWRVAYLKHQRAISDTALFRD